MDWNQPLFDAFMCAVVGGILYMQYQLHCIKKNITPKEKSGNACTEQPSKDSDRMEFDLEKQACKKDLQANHKTNQNITREGN